MINLNEISKKLSSNVLSFEEQQALKGKGRCRRRRCGGGGGRRRRRSGGGCSSSSSTEVAPETTTTSTPTKTEGTFTTDLGGGGWDLA